MDIPACKTTRIYCRPNCPAGRHMLPENGVSFASQEAARQAGYRPCKACKPEQGVFGPWAPKNKSAALKRKA